ncbi:hypothetical protein FBY35_5962 [Streptomyces sp. SLBN-118]|nr:hypothetical protein FBY35_5962 [Streptomyces sp. SLBN-118]
MCPKGKGIRRMIATRRLRAAAASLLVGALAALALAMAPQQHTSVLAEDPNWDSVPVTVIVPPAGAESSGVSAAMDPNWD